MNIQQRIQFLLPKIAELMRHKSWKLCLAESCTGGRIAAYLSSIPGASAWFSYALVTYSNAAKTHYLKVPKQLLETEGAVSAACASAMIEGLSEEQDVIRLATTGYAGPSGDELGLVYIASQIPQQPLRIQEFHFLGDRAQVIEQAVFQSLSQVMRSIIYPLQAKHKCFFALNMDDAGLEHQCLQYTQELGLNILNIEPGNHLHLTLKYLGEKSLDDMHALSARAQDLAQKISVFDLKLDGLAYWQDSQSCVLWPSFLPKPLIDLHQALGSEHDFKPHVTLSKHQERPEGLKSIKPDIAWSVKSFSLMISFYGVFYIEWKRWCLAGNQNCSTQ